jgi:hypothetical protein
MELNPRSVFLVHLLLDPYLLPDLRVFFEATLEVVSSQHMAWVLRETKFVNSFSSCEISGSLHRVVKDGEGSSVRKQEVDDLNVLCHKGLMQSRVAQ